MKTTLLILAGAAILAWWLRRRMAPSVGVLVERAAATGDLGPLLAALEGKRERVRPTAYHQAITRLWDRYERRPAIELIRELAARHPDARIAQYWMQQAITTEPELAGKSLSPEFLERNFQPEVAAACGPAG